MPQHLVGHEPAAFSTAEQQRLDSLLSAARRMHYLEIGVAAAALAAAAASLPTLPLPIGGATLPAPIAAMAALIGVMVLAVGADQLFALALPWLVQDTRRPPFAWVALRNGPVSVVGVTTWILGPVAVTAICSGCILGLGSKSLVLALYAVLVVLFPRPARRYLRHMRDRTDERGGGATFSIYLLYFLRLVRHVLLTTLFLLLPMLAFVPQWQTPLSRVGAAAVVACVVLTLLRLAGSLSYRWVDRLGPRFGFRVRSQHYA